MLLGCIGDDFTGSSDLANLEFGPRIDPGVPAQRARPELVLAMKSGNFGVEEYFTQAERVLAGSAA